MNESTKHGTAGLAHFKTDVHEPRGFWWRIAGWFLRRLQPGTRRAVGMEADANRPRSQADPKPCTLRHRVATWVAVGVGLAGLAVLMTYSLRLAADRIYQVDECMEVYVARKLATGADKAQAGHVTLFQVLLSQVIRGATHAADLLKSGRFLMFEIFWLNLVLIALATGERLNSRRGLAALVGAATLAPLWDYGFEIRHDNLLLTGLLLTWCMVRLRPAGIQSYLIVGAIAVALEFVAFKAFVYTAPLSLAILVFPPPGHLALRWKLALAWVAGAAGAYLAIRLWLGAAGLWELYQAGFNFLSTASSGEGHHRFWPWFTLKRLLTQTPLLLALLASALAVVGGTLRRRGWRALSWEGNFPEAMLFLGALLVLFVNPAPYPYNLLHLVPFGFVFAFRHATDLWRRLGERPELIPVAGSILIFAHLVPFGVATLRHLDWPRTRQETVMAWAENLTDPVRDPVYDAIGMVSTRPIVDNRGFLHSLNLASQLKGPGPQVRDLLAARPAAVFIPSYRTDWLPQADHDFIREHYVSMADDFWVLGKVLPAGGGTFEIIHGGRDRNSTLEGSDLAGTFSDNLAGLLAPEKDGHFEGTIDGHPLPGEPLDLTVGSHRVEGPAGCQVAVVWVGPKANRIHRLSGGDHRHLFFNWY